MGISKLRQQSSIKTDSTVSFRPGLQVRTEIEFVISEPHRTVVFERRLKLITSVMITIDGLSCWSGCLRLVKRSNSDLLRLHGVHDFGVPNELGMGDLGPGKSVAGGVNKVIFGSGAVGGVTWARVLLLEVVWVAGV